MDKLTTDKLAELVSKRLACLKQLCAIGRKQSELIAADKIGDLLRLISTKQRLILALQAIERELQPFHEQHPESRVWPSLQARQQCAAQAEVCQKLLAEVMALEQANEQQMTIRRDQTASQINTAASASKVHGAYQAQQYRTDTRSPANPHNHNLQTNSASLDLRSNS
ncbi:hypothetical protein [Adhaeretor mobilis]|uniref:FlgN protein n=1 Tax=Adhaeretor mobilis TaxID=1930276 RepID=A0A517MYW8_9BACT|nr:hypothetical protein [Adhaeretor mobilis]QDT00060.1 FlgN protein [Adhaeretor mobilis]